MDKMNDSRMKKRASRREKGRKKITSEQIHVQVELKRLSRKLRAMLEKWTKIGFADLDQRNEMQKKNVVSQLIAEIDVNLVSIPQRVFSIMPHGCLFLNAWTDQFKYIRFQFAI